MDSISGGLYEARQSGVDTMSQASFSVAISVFTAINIAIASLGARISYNWPIYQRGTSGWLLLGFFIGCLVVSVSGALWAQSNDSPGISLIGGAICAVAIGVLVGPFVSRYDAKSVLEALILTTGVVVLTGFIGAVIPKDLSGWGPPLFAGLIGLIAATFIVPLFGIPHSMLILDVVGIALFSGLMMYDMNQARYLDRTLNNAIDVAVNTFLNFANIFIRILSLMGNDD